MRPIIIGIGGAHSGVGKTTVASLILKRLKGWKGCGAIKYTKTSLYCSVVEDIKVLSEKGKDTKRLLDAGAEKVLWVQSPFSELGLVLPMAVGMLSHLKGVLVEGNSAIEILKPDIVLFISGAEGKIKKGADKILRMADVVIFDKKPPQGIPKNAKRFNKDDVEGFVDFVMGLVKKCEEKR
jgi:molybdopterin-guanine dinucleotide biosynthesis protein